MNKAILWDLDGTLLYTLQDLTNATNATLRAFGRAERSLEEGRTFVGNGAIQQMRRAVGGEPENFQEIMAYYRAYYPQHCNETTRPYAGILDTATALQAAGWRLAIVSNKPDNATKALWKTYFPTFDLALGEGPDLPRKPAPDMVLRALEQLETPLERAIYIGDSEVDVATARAAGIPCISACWGYRNEEELLAAGARHLCRTPRDIPAALEELRHGQ